MSDEIEYIETDAVLDFDLSHQSRNAWRRIANNAYFGNQEIPMDTPRESISRELEEVHWHINCGRRVKIRVRLYPNGDLEIVASKTIHRSGVKMPATKSEEP